jgi:hypothetical protein
MFKARLLFLISMLFVSTGCGRIWGGVTWQNGSYPSSAFAYQCSTQVFLTGVSTANAPALTGSGFSYSISPPLPTGLSLNPSTGIISGTATGVTALTTYTITITYPGGTTTTTVNLRTAQGYLVNDLSDTGYAGPGCVSLDAGPNNCNLRAAITAINTGGPQNVIVIPPGQISLGSTLPTLTTVMDLYGDCAQGSTVDGGGAVRLLAVNNSGNVSFNSMTLQNGKKNNSTGGAIQIRNTGIATFTVTLNSLLVQNNTLTGVGSDDGGGVYASGNSVADQVILNINNSTFSNNSNANVGGAGGGIAYDNNFTQWTITNSSFLSNTDSAIAYFGNSLSINQSLFYNNSNGSGGAIAINSVATGNISLLNSTFDSNSGTSSGTIYWPGPGPTVTATNCTFTNNSTVSAGAGGVFFETPATLTNNLFYNNTTAGVTQDCDPGGGYTSNGGNLTNAPGGHCGLGGSDFALTVANLGPLQNNGGPTMTHALLTGSPGIDQALTSFCPPTDQRGDTRHLPTSCDIGAYEHEP